MILPGRTLIQRLTAGLLPTVLTGMAVDCAASWPQFLGPHRDGTYTGAALSQNWPKDGPRRLWVHPVGEGFSGPVTDDGKVIINHRVDRTDRVECLDLASGKSLWKHDQPARYVDDFGFDEGPRATPALAQGRVVTVSADGWIRCLKLADGSLAWQWDGREKWGARKGFFGLAPSPLIDGKRVILNIGGTGGRSVVALDLESGRLDWAGGDDEASYASPVIGGIEGRKLALVLTREAFMGFDAAQGTILFRHGWRPRMEASVSGATPLLRGNQVLLTASYDTGATLFDLGSTPPKVVWERQDALSSHYTTPVRKGDAVYGLDGRQERGCSLRCIDWKTGQTHWNQEGWGAGSLILAGDELLILGEKGELVVVEASPRAYQVKRRAQVLPFLARAHPALSQGHFLARSKDKLFCLMLSN